MIEPPPGLSEEEPSLIQARVTILERLLAGCWYAITGFISFLVSLLLSMPKIYLIGSKVFFGFVIVPSAIFALCGAMMGARITPKRGAWPGTLAVGSGAVVALAALGLFMVSWSLFVLQEAEDHRLSVFIFALFYLMGVWGTIRAVPLMLIGGFSGWLLYRFKLKFINSIR